ncbi:MAG: methyltransferase [Bacteroidota bacterium]|jgi:tRNA1Val (adenine37-N6)-methyltransferase|nr:methyltransferase [Bacteroidota bacterium]
MPNQEFVFKQFKIIQDKCAMKVGTDAVLLGSWVNTNNANSILDIGTGTGIIALMLAQRSNAIIDAIDIDKNAFIQATENVAACKWKEHIRVHHISLQEFAKEYPDKFDLIVSNPPYFIDSSKASEESRSNARHTDQLPYDDLLKGVLNLLNPDGKFYVILPTKESEQFRDLAEENKLFLTKLTRVITRTDKPEKRWLMRFEFTRKSFSEDSIIIEEDQRHSYTEAYKELTKEYYLGF